MKEFNYFEFESNVEKKLSDADQYNAQTTGCSSVKIKALNLKYNERSFWDKMKSKGSLPFLLIMGIVRDLMDV